MRALLFHCKQYGVKVGRMANRPEGITPEEVNESEQSCTNCVVALITVEKNDDTIKVSSGLSREISRMCNEVGRKDVAILPFAHLSNNLAKAEDGIEVISLIEEDLKKDFNVLRAHFGSHKELLLNIHGHPGNARYREF